LRVVFSFSILANLVRFAFGRWAGREKRWRGAMVVPEERVR
jgi:hypothetical protein